MNNDSITALEFLETHEFLLVLVSLSKAPVATSPTSLCDSRDLATFLIASASKSENRLLITKALGSVEITSSSNVTESAD